MKRKHLVFIQYLSNDTEIKINSTSIQFFWKIGRTRGVNEVTN